MAKIPLNKRSILQKRARQLLNQGNNEATAAALMVTEGLCSEPIALGIVQWVIAYNWPSPKSKRRVKP